MPYGFPNISFIGYPLSVPCPPHAGMGLRRAAPSDAQTLRRHLLELSPADRRQRFCGTVDDAAIDAHLDRLWTPDRLVIAAFDGPLWRGPLHRPGPVRAMAEVSLAGEHAEIALTVDGSLRRRGMGTCLLQVAAWLVRPRGVRRLEAYTLAGNVSFLTLAAKAGARLERDGGDVEISFPVDRLAEAYLRRRVGEALGDGAAA